MILIQLILILGIGLLLIRFLMSPQGSRTKAWKKIFVMLFAVFAVFLIHSPQSANRLAHLVGVGRGADLLLYMLTLAFIFLCISLYIQEKHDEQRIVTLSRKIAILEAQTAHSKKTGKK